MSTTKRDYNKTKQKEYVNRTYINASFSKNSPGFIERERIDSGGYSEFISSRVVLFVDSIHKKDVPAVTLPNGSIIEDHIELILNGERMSREGETIENISVSFKSLNRYKFFQLLNSLLGAAVHQKDTKNEPFTFSIWEKGENINFYVGFGTDQNNKSILCPYQYQWDAETSFYAGIEEYAPVKIGRKAPFKYDYTKFDGFLNDTALEVVKMYSAPISKDANTENQVESVGEQHDHEHTVAPQPNESDDLPF